MKIIKEVAAPEYGEHDFFLESEDAALFAARALTEAGYMVGGGNDQTRSTIKTESCGANQKRCVVTARKIIENLQWPNV